MSNHDYVSGPKLFRSIKKGVTKSKAPDYLDSLVSDSGRYRSIQEPEWKKWPSGQRQLRDSLRALNVFGVDQPTPFVLSVFTALDTKKIKAPLAKRALRAVENYHFIFTAVTGTSSSGGITKMYALHAREVSAAPDAQAAAATISALIGKLKIPSKDIFIASFVELGYSKSTSKQKRLVRYILERIYSHNCAGVLPDFEQMTIEHLLPESAAKGPTVTAEDIANIGNLVLVDEHLNDRLADKPFIDKKRLLQDAGQVWIDPLILSASSWDHETIRARAEAMAELAYTRIWSG